MKKDKHKETGMIRRETPIFIFAAIIVLVTAACTEEKGEDSKKQDAGHDSASLATQPDVSLLAGTPGGRGTVDGIGENARVDGIFSIAIDGDYAYLADSGNGAIRRLNLTTHELMTFAGKLGWKDPRRMDGAGKEATFDTPWAMAILNGSLYVSDLSREGTRLRRIALDTTEVQTVTDPADGQPWQTEQGATVLGLAAMGERLYIAERSAVWVYNPGSGVFEIVAGDPQMSSKLFQDGTGTDASFYYITSVVGDSDNTLFITDGHTPRKIDAVTYEVATLGNREAYGSKDGVGTSALFLYLNGAAFDNGNLYLTEDQHAFVLENETKPLYASYFGTIRKLEVASLEATTFAGSLPPPSARFGEQNGLALEALFIEPYGIASTADSIYVGTRSTVRRIDKSTGTVTTVTGRLIEGPLIAPGRIVADGSSLYGFVDQRVELVRIDGETGDIATLRSYHEKDYPVDYCDGLALMGSELFCATYSGVIGYDSASGKIRTLPGFDAVLGASPTDLVARGDHLLGAFRVGSKFQIWDMDPKNDTDQPNMIFETEALERPLRIAALGTLLFVSGGTTLSQIDLQEGEVTIVAGAKDEAGCGDGPGSEARFTALSGLAADESANSLFLGDTGCHTLLRYDVVSREITTLAGAPENKVFAAGRGKEAGINSPADLAYDSEKEMLYVSDPRENIIMKVDFRSE